MRLFLVVAFLLLSVVPLTTQAQFTNPASFSGYGWSSNIGWLSFSGSNYGVSVQPSGSIDGYAWSPNIGWVQFGGRTGCPFGTCNPVIDFATNEISGWAHALSQGDGWDGWISLNASNHGGSTYKVEVDGISGDLTNSSYAWGSDVVGWLNLGGVSVNTPCTPSISCNGNLTRLSTNQWCQETTVPCASGYACNAATDLCETAILDCNADPAACGNLSFIPPIVKSGESIQVSWDTELGAFSDCNVEIGGNTLTGLNGTNVDSGPITSTSNVTLTCTALLDGANLEVESDTVHVVPTLYET